MKYLFVKPCWPKIKTRIDDLPDLHLAVMAAGLDPLKTDHGVVARREDSGLAVVVFEFGLFDPRSELWICNQRLYAGNAVIYQFDERGETMDYDSSHDLAFSAVNNTGAEELIGAGLVARPAVRANGETLWQWPQPKPVFIP